jgi:prepilin-type N-terminal cleavage/methylation domain-containing protein
MQKSLFKNIRSLFSKRPVPAGFTLMEVMVAVSIFAIVMTVGIGALLTINNSYRKAQTSRQAIDSLTYVLESMSRSLRTAQIWEASNYYDGTPTQNFSYIDQDANPIVYDLVSGAIVMNASIGEQPINDHIVTPSNVEVTNLTFTAFAPVGGPKYVQINIAGIVTSGKLSSDFSFQTSISKRTIE